MNYEEVRTLRKLHTVASLLHHIMDYKDFTIINYDQVSELIKKAEQIIIKLERLK